MRGKRDPASWAAARAVGAVGQQLLSSLAQASTAQEVARCISTALQLFSPDSAIVGDYVTRQDGGAAQSRAGEDVQQLQPHAAIVGWPALRTIFHDDQFETWACAVLSVAAGEWLPKLQGSERDRLWSLIVNTFMRCPAWYALSALLGHLSAVTLHNSSSSSTNGPSVTAVAADSAAQLLVQRFLAPHSTGLSELLLAWDSSSSSQPGLAQQLQRCAQAAADEQLTAACQQHAQAAALTAERMQEAAGLLAALPDRLQQLLPTIKQLPSAADAASVLLQGCIKHIAVAAAATAAADDGWRVRSVGSSGATGPAAAASAAAAAAAGAIPLTALLLQRLVMRGQGKAAARVVLDLAVLGHPHSHCDSTAADSSTRPIGDTAQQWYPAALQQVLLLLSRQSGTAAAEKLVLCLLRMASCTQPQQQQQQQQQSLEHQQTQQQQRQQQQAVISLLGPLCSLSDQLRSIMLQKLLLTRTLPQSTLQLLLLLLPACQPSLLPEAAAALAQAWSDSSNIVQLPVSQQAFMTAALVSCIQAISRDYLDPSTSAHAAAAAASEANCAAGAAAAAAVSAAAAQLGVQLSPYQGLALEKASMLLSSIIQGVSARLASPSPAIRLQAMRVGQAFARKLDPTKPMFEGAGPLHLIPEEVWPGAVADQVTARCVGLGQQQQQQQHGISQQQQQLQGPPGAAGRSSRTVKALARLAEATEGSDSDDEEALLPAPAAAAAADCATSHATTAAAAVGSDADWESGSVADSEGSASSLVAFDLNENLSAEQWWGPDGLGPVDSKGLGLRALSAALRKQDDVAGALEALKKIEVLIRAEPDELPVVAPELARSIIHCKVPIWASPPPAAAAGGGHSQSSSVTTAEQQTHVPKGISSSAEVQRQQALAAVLSISPLTAGDTVIAELYSPNLDQYQRMSILDGLAAAAAEMADPRKAPQLALQGPQHAPELLPPAAAGHRAKLGAGSALKAGFLQPRAVKSAAADETSNGSADGSLINASINRADSGGSGVCSGTVNRPASSSEKAQAAPGLVEMSSRVWGKVSLQKQTQAAGNNSSRKTFRNRFSPVALRWTTALLQQCDVKQQGVDLFGRDSVLLGRLLTVLGSFVEAAAETPAAVPLCAGLLELLKAGEVSSHKEAFVRRSALVGASQVVRHLPPARLAGAMVGRQSDAQDQVLVERLQWLMSWAQQVAVSDVDQHCKMLAAGCVAWHVQLAEGAMAVLEHLPEPEGPSLVTAGTSGKRAAGLQGNIHVRMPSVDRLVLS